jgi:asparagine synthase (glutamine-hydrolysing)
MCGIAGVVSNQSSTFEASALEVERMLKITQHRGPDNSSIMSVAKNCIVGHNRLAIIDTVSASNQPFESICKEHVISFNGEIYNYLELRSELLQLGYIFRTESDTEVLLNALIEWGTNSLPKLNGMFSFAYINKKSSKLYLVRDRFGIKPLYYKHTNKKLSFCSEIKGLLGTEDRRSNQKMVYDFLRYGLTDHTEETLFKDVKQIPGGALISVDLNDFTITARKWIDIQQTKQMLNSDLATIFDDAIKRHCRSDVTLGSCLSGGLDSSLIVARASALKRAKLTCVHAHYSDLESNELDYAALVAEKSGAILEVANDENVNIYKEIEKIIWHNDEPIRSSGPLSQWIVMKKAKDLNIKVMLDGQGADELFWGYWHTLPLLLLAQFKVLSIFEFSKLLRKLKVKYSFSSVSLLRMLVKANLLNISRGFLNRKPKYLKTYRNKSRLSKKMDKYSLLDCYNLPTLLHWEDRNSMAHSIESRVPFLDVDVANYALSTSTQSIFLDGEFKAPLRTMSKKILPEEITGRKDKMGFATPELVWLRKHKEEFLNDARHAMDTFPHFFNKVAYEKMFHESIKALGDKSEMTSQVFRVAMLGKWLKIFSIHD